MTERLFKYDREFEMELGHVLPRIQLSYCTWGELNTAKDNVIWICHALTANADAADWWEGMVGEGKLYDPSEHFIICVNILGSCYGSTGPLDSNPATQTNYFGDFPVFTIRDIVNSLMLLKDDLGIQKIHTLIGGSMGGQQALEWSIMDPNITENLVLLVTNAKHSPWGIAFNESQRMAIEADPTWKEYSEGAGQNGLRAARSMALISYRNYDAYWNTQSDTDIEKTDKYKAQSYQQYQGEKLVRRFNVHSYYLLSKAMDSHHVGRGRGSIENALSRVEARTLCIGITSDILFPTTEQRMIAENVTKGKYEEIDSFYGHDGFLIETKEITEIISDFYQTTIFKEA